MAETEKQKDKKLYSYKQALSQPYWIQKINDEFSLKHPIKFSRVVYFVVLFGLFWALFEIFMSSAPFGLRGLISAVIASHLSSVLSDLVIDGKVFVVYLIDYLKFYLMHGVVSDKKYINKGQVYTKPKELFQKGEK